MPASALLVAPVAAAAAAASASTPSFLFLLGDDIGWTDFGYNNGTAITPHIDKWSQRAGSIIMQDGHSGGTVCSPTRATVLTGRNHFRDCVNYVYGCSDMTECEPHMPFAQQRTFTFADAVRKAGKGYESWFGGKWHLGSFYKDGQVPSSPLFHGFDHMNATVEVSPTATTNCGCNAEWEKNCNFGHYKKHNHCSGGPGPGAPTVPNGCCFNYWWEDPSSPHGVTNLTNPSYDDDSSYLAEAFLIFLDSRKGKPFAAQVSFHNCHIPFIGTPDARDRCQNGTTCRPDNRHGDKVGSYSSAELDFYSCLSEMDGSVGRILDALDAQNYYDNTFIWFATDNGPEVNCKPEGYCADGHYSGAPGDAGPLRGRKRDIWEGGHRVPTIISWPAMSTGAARVSWDTVVTMDFMATIMDALGVDRPDNQTSWAFDGVSVLPILKGETPAVRGIGWQYSSWPSGTHGYRYGKWKYVHGSVSCGNADCQGDMLFDLEADLSEKNDISADHPDVLAAIIANFTAWHTSVQQSRDSESLCGGHKPPSPPSPPSSDCDWHNNTGLNGADIDTITVTTKEECCGHCKAHGGCAAADFVGSGVYHNVPKVTGVFTLPDDLRSIAGYKCHLKSDYSPKTRNDGSIACVPKKKQQGE